MNWPLVELEQVSEIRGGSTPRRDRPEYWDGNIPWVTPTDLPEVGAGIVTVEETPHLITREGLDSCSASMLPVGTVLFSSRATIGKVGIAGVPLTTNQGFANFIPRAGVDPRYLAWCLLFYSDRIAGLAGSTTFKEVSKGAIRRFRIPLPAISEQRRIVEILDQADGLRRLRAESDAKIGRLGNALFRKMFIDPVTSKGPWPIVPLGNVTREFRYGTSARCSVDPTGLPVLRIPNVIRGEISLADLKYAELAHNEAQRLKLEVGDILFVRTNGNPDYVGRCAVFELNEPHLFASYLIRARLDTNSADPWYVSSFMRTSAGRLAMTRYIRTTAGQSNISVEGLSQIPVPIPPMDEQQRFRGQLMAVRRLTKQAIRAAVSLSRLFESILGRAFNGDLTASWRASHVGDLLVEMEQQAALLAESAERTC